MKPKIFQFSEVGTTFIMAYTLEEAIKEYEQYTEYDPENDLVKELTDIELEQLDYIHDEDDPDTHSNFKEELQKRILNKAQIPDLFAVSY